jgi:predicted helicase
MLTRKNNVGLITNRQIVSKEFSHILVSNLPISHGTFYLGNKGQDYLAPLYFAVPKDEATSGLTFSANQNSNLTEAFLERVSATLGVKRSRDSLPEGLTPEEIFNYAYAVFHSPEYRSRYAEFLKIDFPRLPLTSSIELFRALARLGGDLISLHLMESPKLDSHLTKFKGSRNPQVEKVTWADDTVWLDKAQTTGFAGVPEPVWNFHIGGYQVCEKWLKDRKGRTLSAEDIAHYHKIVVALSETIRLMSEIDSVIETHGGWPIK